MQFVQGQMVPTFTTHGFEVVKCPEKTFAKLRNAVEKGVKNWDNLPFEPDVEAIYGELPPKFIDIGGLAHEINEELKEFHEQW